MSTPYHLWYRPRTEPIFSGYIGEVTGNSFTDAVRKWKIANPCGGLPTFFGRRVDPSVHESACVRVCNNTYYWSTNAIENLRNCRYDFVTISQFLHLLPLKLDKLGPNTYYRQVTTQTINVYPELEQFFGIRIISVGTHRVVMVKNTLISEIKLKKYKKKAKQLTEAKKVKKAKKSKKTVKQTVKQMIESEARRAASQLAQREAERRKKHLASVDPAKPFLQIYLDYYRRINGL